MKYILILVFVLAFAACGSPAPSTPDEESIQTAIAQTLAAQPVGTEAPTLEASSTPTQAPTDTPKPTTTAGPTNTPKPSATPTEQLQSVEDIRTKFIELITDFLERGEGLEAVEKISVVRFGEHGIFEIEVNSIYSAKDNQPDLSYDIIRFLAQAVGGGLVREQLMAVGGGDDFTIHITTYSTDGDYRYQSDTNYETLVKLRDRQITYEEWVAAASAGFR